jgi:hypothetical protein
MFDINSIKLIFLAGALTIWIAGFIVVCRVRTHGALDPLALFCAAFAAYNGLILLRVGMQANPNDLVLPYPVSYAVDNYIRTGLFSILAITTVAVTATLSGALNSHVRLSGAITPPLSGRRASSFFLAGMITYTCGAVLLVLQLQQGGGLLAFIATSRTDRYRPELQSGFSFPYSAFFNAGLALIFFAAFGSQSKSKQRWSYVLLGLWCLTVVVSGDRRPIIGAALAFLCILTMFRTGVLRVTFNRVAMMLCAYAAFTAFGQIREILPGMVLGKISVADASSQIWGSSKLDWLLPENTEFAGPYFSLLESADSKSERLWGKSYYDSLAMVLPRFLYGGDKPQSLALGFAESAKIEYNPSSKSIPGWGYNPVAEAYDNFSIGGIVCVFWLWTMGFIWLGNLSSGGPFASLCFALLIPQAVNANRIDFRVVFVESFYVVGALAFGYVLSTLIPSSDVNPHRNYFASQRGHVRASGRKAYCYYEASRKERTFTPSTRRS